MYAGDESFEIEEAEPAPVRMEPVGIKPVEVEPVVFMPRPAPERPARPARPVRPVRPVITRPGPVRQSRSDARRLLVYPIDARRGIVMMEVLGPCRGLSRDL
jgi:hypothetical protein